jgi:hypothetical protein
VFRVAAQPDDAVAVQSSDQRTGVRTIHGTGRDTIHRASPPMLVGPKRIFMSYTIDTGHGWQGDR